jgi:putative peptide maturation system protein
MPEAVADLCGFVTRATLAGSTPDQARAALAELADRWPELTIRLVASAEAYDGQVHFDALATAPEGTCTVSFAPAGGLPWPLRGLHRWSEQDVLRVNGTVLPVEQAIACLDFVWDRPHLLRHLIDVCLVEEELDRRGRGGIDDGELQRELDRFRRARGLLTPAATHAWLAAHGLTHEQLERQLADQVRVSRLVRELFDDEARRLAREQRGRYARLPVAVATAPDERPVRELRNRLGAGAGPPAVPLDWLAGGGPGEREVRHATVGREDVPEPVVALFADEAPAGAVTGVYPSDGRHAVAVKLGPAVPAEPTEHTVDRVRQHLFRDWLRDRRTTADVEWYWGPRSLNQ